MRSIAFIVAVLVLAPAAATAARVETRDYVGGTGDVTLVCDPGVGLSVGGVCFFAQANETSVRLIIDDDSGSPVGAAWRWRDVNNTFIEEATFCGEVVARVPPGGFKLVLLLDEVNGLFDCPLAEGLGAATKGVVRAEFT